MLKNYIKIALKVFWRHKFFTAVNLLGICFTLVVLIAAVALIDQQTGVADVAPEVHNDRTLYLKWLFVRSAITDTSGTVSQHSAIAPGIAYRFLDRYVRPLETAENVAVFSDVDYRGLHGGAEEGHVTVQLTDGAFWEVFDFDFRQGRPYTAAEVEAGEVIAIISVGFSRRFFGSEEAVGKIVPIEGRPFRVVGVVADVPHFRRRTKADIWVPLTTDPPENWHPYRLIGGGFQSFQAAVLARQPADMERIKAEFATVLEQVEPDPTSRFSFAVVFVPLVTALDEWAIGGAWRMLADEGYTTNEEWQQAIAHQILNKLLVYGGLMLLFMLLPAFHLVNLNISRIEERASEIGVRKAFGGSVRALVGQFVAENVLLTLLGVALCLPLSWGILVMLSLAGIAYVDVPLLLRTVAYGTLLSVFFGVLSGAYPAWKMARLHPMRALTGREL